MLPSVNESDLRECDSQRWKRLKRLNIFWWWIKDFQNTPNRCTNAPFILVPSLRVEQWNDRNHPYGNSRHPVLIAVFVAFIVTHVNMSINVLYWHHPRLYPLLITIPTDVWFTTLQGAHGVRNDEIGSTHPATIPFSSIYKSSIIVLGAYNNMNSDAFFDPLTKKFSAYALEEVTRLVNDNRAESEQR